MQITEQNKKYLTYAAIGVGLIVAYKVFAPATDSSSSTYDPTGNGTNGVPNPSYVFNASNVATQLYNAMKDSGTKEDKIVSALTPVSQTQFGQVITAFGSLPYNPALGNQYFWLWATPTKYKLPFWLESELSAARYALLKNKYPSYL